MSENRPRNYRELRGVQAPFRECHINAFTKVVCFVVMTLITVSCASSKDAVDSHDEISVSEDTAVPAGCEVPAGEGVWADETLRYEHPGCASIQLSPMILGEGELSIELIEFEGGWAPHITAVGEARFDGLVLTGAHEQVGAADAVLWRQGYQSWSFSGVTALGDLPLDEWGVPVVGGDGDAVAVKDELAGTSWWMGSVGRSDGGSLFLGVVGALKTRFFVAFDAGQAWAVWGHRGDSIALEDGETLVLDPLWMGSGSDPNALHQAYADATVERIPIPDLGVRPPSGWATWYHFFEDISEADVRENLVFATALEPSDPDQRLDVFQIDDGWQRLWGDWQADDGFPSGMPALATDIAAAGFIPGLWMAPFYVDRNTETYVANPDWWVLRPDGEEIRFTNLNTGDYAVLDVTHPDAAAWLSTEISSKVAEGWTYLKLDFLYAGAQVGVRHLDVTGIEAFHMGMQIIREAAGEAWILACGSPFLPSLGYAESFRTGADIAFGFDRDPQLAYLRWAGRSTAARSWTNGRWWWIDPDQILVRPPFTDIEATGAVVANVVSGGTWMLGDDLPALSDERMSLAIHPDLMALRGVGVAPRSPLSFVSGVDPGPPFEGINPNDTVPLVWDFEDGTIALLNLSDEAVEIEAPGGTELLSGEVAAPLVRTLAPGAGEVWRAD